MHAIGIVKATRLKNYLYSQVKLRQNQKRFGSSAYMASFPWRKTMTEQLSAKDLLFMVQRVFQPRPEDKAMAILVDLPDARVEDNPAWRKRREMAADWAKKLQSVQEQLGLKVNLLLYCNAHTNNADLPASAWLYAQDDLPEKAEDLAKTDAVSFDSVFEDHGILIAPTEFSPTAPLKLAAREKGIRAATMPGFSADMIPALRLDYQEINRRVAFMSGLLTRAQKATLDFVVDGRTGHRLELDLRHRQAHSSGGLFPDPGVAGNLPSGESYIVPYEGELDGDASGSAGQMPVQFGDDVVVYTIENNRAVAVAGEGQAFREEALHLDREPAYGNLAELGLGVLSDFGLEPIGEILLDEKLGLHIAFGRSDHFGGHVGAAQFSGPDEVIHIDRVYIEALQPRIVVAQVELELDDGARMHLMRNGHYVVDFRNN
jgi:hypothetical protein